MISVVIPVRQTSGYLLNENLPAMAKQTYKDFEVIVLPNNINTHEKNLLKKYSWLRIIPTGIITRPAEKRDIGVNHARGDFIAFIDDDAYPTKNWLQNADKILKKKRKVALCGPGILPPTASFWEKVFDEVLKSFIGSGSYNYRFIKKSKRIVDDYPSMNFFIHKETFKKLGGFNCQYWPGEDSKLCEDLVYKEHQSIYYDPSVTVYHHRRDNLSGFLKQHANYGFHRGAFFAHGDKNSTRFAYLLPSAFFLYFIILIAACLFSIFNGWNSFIFLLIIPLLLYFLVEILFFVKSYLSSKNAVISLTAGVTIFLMHIVYGMMFINGFFKGLILKSKIYD